MSDIYLNPEEIEHITGKKKVKAQREVLQAMGYQVKGRPDGTFWVPRAQFLDKPAQGKKYSLNFGALNDGAAA